MTTKGLSKSEFALYSQIQQLRGANRRLLRQLADQRIQREELVEAVYKAAKDAATALELPPIKSPKLDRRQHSEEVAIAVLSDWQLAKRTRTYSIEVCTERVTRYADKLLKITDISRADHPVKRLRVYLLGDMVEGELIFPGQAWALDASLYRQVLVDGPQILGDFLRRMAGAFEAVHIVTVVGNHGSLGGRARREYHPESNADAMLYGATQLFLREQPRLTWALPPHPGERRWYAVDRIGDKGYLLIHGDQIRGGFAGFPWYVAGKKLLRWRNSGIQEPFDFAFGGHHHNVVKMTVGSVRYWGNGSLQSDDPWVAEEIASQDQPAQLLLYATLDSGVTSEHEIRVG